MKRIFILTFLLTIKIAAFSQRIGLDVSTRLENFNLTLTYHQIIQSNFLLSVGFFTGGNGNAFAEIDSSKYDAGNRIRSPYSSVNTYSFEPNGDFGLLAYAVLGKSSGFHFSAGYFKQLNDIHSLRFHLNSKWGVATSEVRAYYRSSSQQRTEAIITLEQHWIGSVGLEAFHGVRMGNRISLYYGLKLPYYFSIDQSTFAPVHSSDLFFRLKPELSVGLTYYVGKCN